MAVETKKNITYAKAPIAKKVKMGGHKVVSAALIKKGASKLVPKMHVKRGDRVMVIAGSKEHGKGQIGKVISVFPRTGKVVVEGINIVTRGTKGRGAMGKSGLIKKEAPIYASRVMLYSEKSKKPVRAEFRKKEEID
jgi:large subunit ribosomal protein L24